MCKLAICLKNTPYISLYVYMSVSACECIKYSPACISLVHLGAPKASLHCIQECSRWGPEGLGRWEQLSLRLLVPLLGLVSWGL